MSDQHACYSVYDSLSSVKSLTDITAEMVVAVNNSFYVHCAVVAIQMVHTSMCTGH